MTAETFASLAQLLQALVVLPMLCGVFGEPARPHACPIAVVSFGVLSMAHERVVKKMQEALDQRLKQPRL